MEHGFGAPQNQEDILKRLLRAMGDTGYTGMSTLLGRLFTGTQQQGAAPGYGTGGTIGSGTTTSTTLEIPNGSNS